MSYAIMPYAVDLDGLRSMIGSRDERLLAGLLFRWARELEDVDGLRDDVGPSGDDVTSARAALRQMIMGEEYDARVGFVYGYCLKILCAAEAGSGHLSNEGWWGMRFGWFDTVRAELKSAGVEFDPTDLIFGGPPIPLPRIGDSPNIGHLGQAELSRALDSFGGLDEDAVAGSEASEAILQIRAWLRECVRSGRDLVCFYH